ncbi:MAG: hypothetical protein AAF561_04465 [Planctomycetota bacterium]
MEGEHPMAFSPHAAFYCGQCGYDLRGLTITHCPECGSHVRSAGFDSERRKPVNLVARCMLWLVLVGLVALMTGGAARSLLPRQLGATYDGEIVKLDSGELIAVAIELDYEVSHWRNEPPPPPTSVVLRLALMQPSFGDDEDRAENAQHFDQSIQEGRRAADAARRATPVPIDLTDRDQAVADITDVLETLGRTNAVQLAHEIVGTVDSELRRSVGAQLRQYSRSRAVGWSSSSGGGSSGILRLQEDVWMGRSNQLTTRLSQHPHSDLFLLVLYGVPAAFGLYCIVAGIDPRPKAWQRRTTVAPKRGRAIRF